MLFYMEASDKNTIENSSHSFEVIIVTKQLLPIQRKKISCLRDVELTIPIWSNIS